MFDSPPFGRAQSRAPLVRAPLTALLWAVTLSLLFSLAIASQSHAKKKKRKDTRAPYVVSAVTSDADGDGRVDGVVLTYSEKVRYVRVRKGKGKAKKRNRKKIPWRTPASHKFLGVSVQPGGKTVRVAISEADAVDTAERPSVTYLRVPKGARGITDRAGNQALVATVKSKDGLSPVVTSVVTRDANLNGRVDTLRFTYSESVEAPDSTKFAVTGYAVTGAVASGATVDVSVAEQGIDTQAAPATSAAVGAVKDVAGNGQATDQSAAAADGAPPAVIDAVTADTNANGRLDRITVKFSEPVTHAAEAGSGALAATGLTTSSVGAASVDSIDLSLADAIGAGNTGLKPTITTTASASPVSDLAGNVLGASTFTATRDGAAPVLLAARTRDQNGNGRLDGVAATFSETVSYTAGLGDFSSSTTQLGTFSGSASTSGATVTAGVNEYMAEYNTDLPRTSPSVPLPITYTAPMVGGVVDSAGNVAVSKTVQATDGAGPAIVYAETVDNNPRDGHIDGVNVGFSEPIQTLVGNPLKIAGGNRKVAAAGSQIITSGSPGDPLYRGVYVPLYPLTTDGTTGGPLADPDTADRPTVEYATVYSGSTRTDYAADTAQNAVVATGSQAFTGTLDRVPPALLTLQAQDTVLDGQLDRLRAVWSEPIQTNGSPSFATLSPVNGPLSGYTPPAPVPGAATASGFVLTVPLTAGTDADRDMVFQSQYTPSGPSDSGVSDLSGNNAAQSPAMPLTTSPVCTDVQESTSAGQDDSATYARATGLDTVDGNYLATLCGGDSDYYKFTAAAGDVGKTISILLAPSPEALAARAGNSYNPFAVTGPGGPVTLSSISFDNAAGWIGRFTVSSAGEYRVGITDASSPLLDYGYCISRTDDGTDPSCSVRQGDLVITEVLRDIDSDPPSVGPYVEIKNVSSQPHNVGSGLELVTSGASCTIQAYAGTNTTIPPGGTFYVSNTSDPGRVNDFGCPGMSIDFSQPIRLQAIGGTVDAVDLGGTSPPTAYTVQLRAGAQWETSSANDDVAGSWCLSADAYGTWGQANNQCDEFRINEVGFLPSTSDRDGKVYVEIKGTGPLTPSSTLLAGWRVRVKPKGLPGAFFVLPPTANPNSDGLFVLADSPASGMTQVPLYSVESANLLAGDTANGGAVSGRNLDQYLRADRPVTVELLRPASGDPLSCDMAAEDVLGFSPTVSGTLGPDDNDGACGPAYATNPFGFPFGGYDPGMVVQRDNVRQFQGDNQLDFCVALNSPMRASYYCNIAT